VGAHTVGDDVTCERCGQMNAADQRYCGMCGAALTATCPACGHANPHGFRYCGSCGSPLDEAARKGAAPVEERRWATVLFADLSGFTGLSENLDPEEVRLVADRSMRSLGAAVERFGGVVANVAGDGLLAVFGAPQAHEDDPERAVRAGLEMQRCAREKTAEFAGLALRVGVNTGEMMFAPVGPESRREPTVHGDVVNTASRLETAAPLGGVLVGEQTFKATRDKIAYERMQPVRAKGKADAVHVWLAVGATEAPAKRALSTGPMVGRDAELDLLSRMWERALAERRAHLVTVLGPPGIGKTRLVDEFLRRIRVRDSTTAVYSGRCLPYGQGITYWPLREILWAAAGIPLDDTAPAAGERLRRLVARLVAASAMDAAAADRTVFALGLQSGLPLPENPLERLSPEHVAEEVALAWPRLLSAVAAVAPAIVVIEDLHWADPPLLEMVERILLRSTGRLFIIATARPEFAELNPGWSSRRAMSQISLEPLTEGQSRRLVDELLPEAQPELGQKIIAAADGNPFFAEEIVRHLAEEGVLQPKGERVAELGSEVTLAIPSTVRALLAARIDSIPEPEKAVLQDAAVVGRSFWATTLEALRPGTEIHGYLASLEERGLIVTRPSTSLPGHTELWFRHALTREVAYQSLPLARRAIAHADVGRWIEQLAGDRREEFIDLVAHHYESAASPEAARLAWPEESPEGEEVRAKAVEAMLRAGGAAEARHVAEQALGSADRALRLARTDRERLAGLELRARSLHAAVRADEALSSYVEALEIARRLGDGEAVSRLRAYATLLCARYSGAFTEVGWQEAAVEMVNEGLAEVGEDAESFEAGALLVGRSRMPRWLGTATDREQTRRDADRAIQIAETIDSSYLLAYAVEALSQPTVQDGFCEAAAIGERMLEVAETLGDRVESNETLVLAAQLFARGGRAHAAEEAADKAARQADQLSPHRRLHAAGAQTSSLLATGNLTKLQSATARVPELIHEDGGRACPYGALALAGHALSLFEAEQPAASAAVVDLLEAASQGAEGPTLLYRAAEIVRPVVSLNATRSRLERIPRSGDTVPRIYELRAALQLAALSGDWRSLDRLIEQARALAGPGCAPSLAWICDWAEAVRLARSGAPAEALEKASGAGAALGGHGEAYTGNRLLVDLLQVLDGQVPPAVAEETAGRLERMGALASAREAREASG
jgi:class 3 adenylate cyclase/tetratricopeptide (TPR) repeat protein